MGDKKTSELLDYKGLGKVLNITPAAARNIPPEKLPRINISQGERPRWRWEQHDVERFKQLNKIV